MENIVFEIPKGYKLNKECSNNDRIVLSYNEWITYDELLEKAVTKYNYFGIERSTNDYAFQKLRVIVDYYNNRDNIDYNKYAIPKYYILYSAKYKKYIIEECYKCISTPLLFINKWDAEFVIRNPNFRQILDDYFNIK